MIDDLKVVCRTNDPVRLDAIVRRLRSHVIPVDVRTEWTPGSVAAGVPPMPIFSILVRPADHELAISAMSARVRDPRSE
jgi:hypothetical protein